MCIYGGNYRDIIVIGRTLSHPKDVISNRILPKEFVEILAPKEYINRNYDVVPQSLLINNDKLNKRTRRHLNMNHRCRRYFFGRN